MRNRLLIAVPAATTAVLSVLFGFALVHGWFGPTSTANRYFCEYAATGLLREPSNTISNLGFVAAGFWSAWILRSGKFRLNENPMTRDSGIAILFPLLAIFLGFGSAALHATETDFGGDLDLLGMYLVAGFIAAYALCRFFGWGRGAFAAILVLAVVFCEAAGMYKQPVIPVVGYAGDAAFAFLIAFAVFVETLNALLLGVKRENRWGAFSLISFLAAFAIWNLGRNDCPVCGPGSLWQPHALWHLLFALAICFVFRMYVSEDTRRA